MIHLLDKDDFLACTVATKVLEPDVRILSELATVVIQNDYHWCITNRDPKKGTDWWQIVQWIEENFSWNKFLAGDPITAKVHRGNLEFGSIEQYGGGCHRSIALAVAIQKGRIRYSPFDIMLYCP
jgi:hypothetical protein